MIKLTNAIALNEMLNQELNLLAHEIWDALRKLSRFWEETLDMDYISKILQSSDIAKDAERYRWIRAQGNLELRTCRTYGTPWTNTETGEKFYPSHDLAVNGTGFGGIEKLDNLIDQAMSIYPPTMLENK
jgi:hypothetical protein